MTDNEKLQLWQLGVVFNNIPDYSNDDTAAMSLLDTLVEKGFEPCLQYQKASQDWGVQTHDDAKVCWDKNCRSAIVSACLEVARKEMGNEENYLA